MIINTFLIIILSSLLLLPIQFPLTSLAALTISDSLIIMKDQLNLSESLQQELDREISKAKAEIKRINQQFSINLLEKIGIIYFHKGGNQWQIKFTYGNLVLNPSQEIILSTSDLWQLKNCFQTTQQIIINGQSYLTTQSLEQVGPMLHFPYDYRL